MQFPINNILTVDSTSTPDMSRMLGGAVQGNTRQTNPLGNVLGGLFRR
jgi:hypothetical protein